MKSKTLIFGLAAVLLAGATINLRADDFARLEKAVAELDAAGRQPPNPAHVFERISKDTGVSVLLLERQKNKSRLGFGGLFIANTLARSTGKTFDQISAEHKAGKGWGAIANENHLKLGPLVSAARKSERGLDNDRTDEHAEHHGNPHQEERPSSPPEPGHGAGGPHGHGGR
jgi:hypothetical protein